MPVSVNLQTVHPRKLAAVRREVAPGAIGSAWGPALGKVWEFIRSQPGTAAATTLLKVMVDQSTPASLKVRAAECVMTHSSKAIEIEDIEARVSELERAAAPQKARQ